MSKLVEFRQLERDLAEQLAALEALKADKGLEQEIEFESKLRSLMGEYSKSLKEVIAILDPQATVSSAKGATLEKRPRKARAVKVYKNPHTGELIETKGGNHRSLRPGKSSMVGKLLSRGSVDSPAALGGSSPKRPGSYCCLSQRTSPSGSQIRSLAKSVSRGLSPPSLPSRP